MDLFARGRSRMHPLSIPRAMANAGASAIAMEFGLRGPSFTISTACSSANHALGQAAWLVRNGTADVALVFAVGAAADIMQRSSDFGSVGILVAIGLIFWMGRKALRAYYGQDK